MIRSRDCSQERAINKSAAKASTWGSTSRGHTGNQGKLTALLQSTGQSTGQRRWGGERLHCIPGVGGPGLRAQGGDGANSGLVWLAEVSGKRGGVL